MFESHITTHPVIRLNTEALSLAVHIYCDLNRIEFALDIVDFVEEIELQAPEVYNALLKAYIRRGEVDKAEKLLLRMKRTQCEITPELYFKLAQLFAANGREEAIKEIHQEALIWFPEDAHRIQAVLIRYYLSGDRLEEAQAIMRDMYITGTPFHPSIFATLLETRLRLEFPDAIIQTLQEMSTLGVTPSSEFSNSVIQAMLKADDPDTALNFISALREDKHLRTPHNYHMIMSYHLARVDHIANIRVYKVMREDLPLSRFTFMRVIPSLSAFSMRMMELTNQSDIERVKETYIPLLLMVLEDLIASPIEPEPMTVGYLIDLLARDYKSSESLRLAKHCFSELQRGAWKRSAGMINCTAYGLYHYGTLEEQCEFVDYIISTRSIPPAYVIAIILRQMKREMEASETEAPPACRFDLPDFVTLLEQHAFYLELPMYIVDRFATALISRGMQVEASQMFAATMQSMRPIDARNFNSYEEAASWLKKSPQKAAFVAKHSAMEAERRSGEKASSKQLSAPDAQQNASEGTSSDLSSNIAEDLSLGNNTSGDILTEAELEKDLPTERLRKKQTSSEKRDSVNPHVDHDQQYSGYYEAHPEEFRPSNEGDSKKRKQKPNLSKFNNSL